MSLIYTILHLNYLIVLVVAIGGFMFGWLWYSPLLFSRVWMEEMKLDARAIEAAKPRMPWLMAAGFFYTLLSTFALTALITSHRSESVPKAAMLGGFIGILFVGVRQLNGALWEQRSFRLQAITVGHEVLLFTLQAAVLGAWL